MKKRIILSAMMLVGICLLMSAATYAYFTASASNTANTFTAGTVAITASRDMGDPIPGPMFYTTTTEGLCPGQRTVYRPTGPWSPGKTVTRTLIVNNVGSLDANISKVSAELYNIANPAFHSEFAQEVRVKIEVQSSHEVIYDGYLAGLLNGSVGSQILIPVASTGLLYLDFTVSMDTDAGNNLQGLLPKINFWVYADQLH